jgi:hypothetical protein
VLVVAHNPEAVPVRACAVERVMVELVAVYPVVFVSKPGLAFKLMLWSPKMFEPMMSEP